MTGVNIRTERLNTLFCCLYVFSYSEWDVVKYTISKVIIEIMRILERNTWRRWGGFNKWLLNIREKFPSVHVSGGSGRLDATGGRTKLETFHPECVGPTGLLTAPTLVTHLLAKISFSSKRLNFKIIKGSRSWILGQFDIKSPIK